MEDNSVDVDVAPNLDSVRTVSMLLGCQFTIISAKPLYLAQ